MADGRNRAWLRRQTDVPDNHADWATRVLSVLVALVLLAVYILIGKIGEANALLVESTRMRQQYQTEQILRTCVVLAELQVTPTRLKALGC